MDEVWSSPQNPPQPNPTSNPTGPSENRIKLSPVAGHGLASVRPLPAPTMGLPRAVRRILMLEHRSAAPEHAGARFHVATTRTIHSSLLLIEPHPHCRTAVLTCRGTTVRHRAWRYARFARCRRAATNHPHRCYATTTCARRHHRRSSSPLQVPCELSASAWSNRPPSAPTSEGEKCPAVDDRKGLCPGGSGRRGGGEERVQRRGKRKVVPPP